MNKGFVEILLLLTLGLISYTIAQGPGKVTSGNIQPKNRINDKYR